MTAEEGCVVRVMFVVIMKGLEFVIKEKQFVEPDVRQKPSNVMMDVVQIQTVPMDFLIVLYLFRREIFGAVLMG